MGRYLNKIRVWMVDKMSEKKFERNCNTCKKGLFSICDDLKNNAEYQAIKEDDILETRRFEFKESHICEDYKCMYIEYPIEVSKIVNKCEVRKPTSRVGKFVKIRPCAKEYNGKTYLGMYLGEQPTTAHISHNPDSKELTVSFRCNPAIMVFDLGKIIYGYESWWSIIENEKDLKSITDTDIENVWYVKALKQI